jgi:hypothetical protein
MRVRGKLLLLGVLASAGLGTFGAWLWHGHREQAHAQQAATAAPAAQLKEPAVPLPLTRVTLFSAGVGHFIREGEVEGTVRADFNFRPEHINDVLKSLVANDLGGGTVSTVTYDSQDPVEKTLRSFAINLHGNPSLAQILIQARGERVEVVLQQTAITQPGTLTGSILGVEKQKQPAGNTSIDVDVLNLWCAEGVRSIKLADIQRIRFLNPNIESEFRRALETLAYAHDTQKKTVSVIFSGEGKRLVRVSYLQENPIWKMSYRLVLHKEGKPYLQGWAIVENQTDEDWQGVRVGLVSGRPISFIMDLYQPLYVPRPVVDLELLANLRPVTYTGAMQSMEQGGLGAALSPGAPQGGLQSANREKQAGRAAAADAAKRDRGDADELELRRAAAARQFGQNLARGIESVASAQDLGDFFEYSIEHPVTLPRQKSALLPVITQRVEGRRVSIYNERHLAKHPLLGFYLKNTTGLHLLQGPITVFDDSTYAGEAKIGDIQRGEERLLSYAVDLGTEVEPQAKRQPDRLVAVRVQRGVLYATNKVREEKTYVIRNRSEQDRVVLIEHPYRGPDFKLIAPEKPLERARDVYRFEVTVPKGETKKLEVIEERDVVSTVALSNADDQTIRIFLQSPITSQKVKDALSEIVQRKHRLAQLQQELTQTQAELKILVDDQARLRANMQALPPSSETYKRYLKKLDEQEPLIDKYQERIKALQQDILKQRQALDNYLVNLNLD